MKSFIILAIIFAMTSAQRPFFAGSSPKGTPELASRFKTESPPSSGGASGASTPTDIVNRLGDDEKSTTPKLPIEANGDVDLVNRIKTWPRENQPFWYINQEHIDKHLNRAGANQEPVTTQGKQPIQKTITRTSFDGKQEVPDTITNNKDLKVIETEEPFDGIINGKKPKYVKVVYRYYYD